jgi:protein-disulfide isomerase
MRLSILGAAALALFLAGCGDKGGDASGNSSAPLTQIPAPNGGDWTETVAATPEGGFLMGNPEAPVKLVEYASITCPHCAEFAEQGTPTLRDQYVKSGRVSWEYRPYMIFPTDAGIFSLLKCQAAQSPASFFQLAEQLYSDQQNWVGKYQAQPPEVMQQLSNLPPKERSAAMVRATGLEEFFRQRGMPVERIVSCLADETSLTQLAEQTDRATSQEGVTGTPSFFINGRMVPDAGTWDTLQPALRAAVR